MKRIILVFILLFSGILFSACSNPFAKKEKSGLQVQISDKVRASVYLDDNFVEKTPFVNRELNPGEYKLTIQPDDPQLIPYETNISLKPGLLTVVTWKLAKRPEFSGGVIYEMEKINSKDKSEISFVTIPDGAIVSVAGKDKTFSPVIIPDVTPGHVEFEVSLPSYGTQQHTINALPGYRMLITVKLAKESLEATTKQETTPSEVEPLSPNQEASQEAKPEASSSAQSSKMVRIKSTNFYVSGKEVLRVRDLPGSKGKELGFAEVGQLYPYLEEEQENWLKIKFSDQAGWVSGQYAELVQ